MQNMTGSRIDGTVASRQPEIMAELDMLEKSVMELAEIAGALVERLGPVLRQEPSGTIKSNGSDPTLSFLGGRLRANRERIEDAVARLCDAASKLEI